MLMHVDIEFIHDWNVGSIGLGYAFPTDVARQKPTEGGNHEGNQSSPGS